MGYQVGLTEEARSDLGAAVRFIAEEGRNPEVVRIWDGRKDPATFRLP